MKNLGNMNYKTINWIARQTATALALLCLTITMSAADGDRFLVPVPLNGTGSTIMRFTVLSEADKTCMAGVNGGTSEYNVSALASKDVPGDIVIPAHVSGYTVVSVNKYAFRGCPNLTSVTVPYTVTEMGENPFYNSENLKTIILNTPLVGMGWLKNNAIVERVELSDSIRLISVDAFAGCTHLTEIIMSENLKDIYPRAFKGCSSLSTIWLPYGLETISEEAFSGCKKLTEMGIPGTVKYIVTNAFTDCTSLRTVRIDEGENPLNILGTGSGSQPILFRDCPLANVTMTRTIITGNNIYSPFRNNKSLKSVWMGGNVTHLPDGAFYGCTSLNEVKTSLYYIDPLYTPPTRSGWQEAPLKDISNDAFYGCSSLPTIELPSTVKEIGDNAFYGCSALESVGMPEGVTSIGKQAFMLAGLKTVTIPSSVTKIGQSAFAQSGLHKIYFEQRANNSPCAMGNEVFSRSEQLDSVFLPAGTTIGKSLFKGCTGLTVAQLPENITNVPEHTFDGCRSLKAFDMSDLYKQVTIIGSYAFNHCEALTSIVLPESVTQINRSAFELCIGLKSVKLNKGLVMLSENAFASCKSLISIELPETLTTLEPGVFQHCTSLKSLTIPNTVTVIGQNLLEGCTALEELISFSSSFIDKIPGQPCVALVSPWVIDKYNQSNVRPIVTVKTTQSTATVHGTSDFDMWWAASKNGESQVSGDGGITITGLAPNRQQKINIGGQAFNRVVSGDIDIRTADFNVDIEFVKATNLTLTVKGTCQSGDATVTKTDFGSYGTGTETTITGLYPGERVNVTFNVTTIDGTVKSSSKTFSTAPVQASVSAVTTATTCTLKGSYTVIDAKVINSGFIQNDYQGDELVLTGLDPSETYDGRFYPYKVNVGKKGSVTITESFTTKPLELTTLPPKVVNLGEAVVCATTNIDDCETNVGFEWRKEGAPDVVPSKTGTAVIYDGTMEGMLKNLAPTSYWIVRPYYKSDAGNSYYGEWIGIDSSDFSYFEPTVHTYANAVVSLNSATLSGYVMGGTDMITEQGFEYWPKDTQAAPQRPSAPAQVMKVTGSGQRMTVQVSALACATTYCYRAYVTTGRGTTYGEELTFTTLSEEQSAIAPVGMATKHVPVAYYSLQGRKLDQPEHGRVNIVRYADGTTAKVFVK